MDSAESCFDKYGIGKTTMDDIAKMAGVSRPTVYRHFPLRDPGLRPGPGPGPGAGPDRAGPAVLSRAHRVSAEPSRAELTTKSPGPPVINDSAAPGTWLTDVPRIWRTASVTRLIPCTKPSARFPPEVLTGSPPSGAMRFSKVRKAPAFPAVQKLWSRMAATPMPVAFS